MRIEAISEFIVFSKHLGFSKAARELNLTQSALSKHMAALEAELGCKLIDRTGSVLKLTALGNLFLTSAQRIEAVYQEEIERLEAARHDAPPLRLLWFDGNSPAIDEFLGSLDNLPFTCVQARGTESYFADLERGDVDALMTFDVSRSPLAEQARQRGIKTLDIGARRGAFLLCNSNPHLVNGTLTRESLHGAEILIASGSVYDEWGPCLKSLLGEDLDLKTVLHPVDGNLANLRYADYRNSVLFLSWERVRTIAGQRSGLVVVDELDGEPILIPMAILYHRDNANPRIQELVNRAMDWFAEIPEW